MLQQRPKHRKKSDRKTIGALIANMAASGLVEDEIALRLDIDCRKIGYLYYTDCFSDWRRPGAGRARH